MSREAAKTIFHTELSPVRPTRRELIPKKNIEAGTLHSRLQIPRLNSRKPGRQVGELNAFRPSGPIDEGTPKIFFAFLYGFIFAAIVFVLEQMGIPFASDILKSIIHYLPTAGTLQTFDPTFVVSGLLFVGGFVLGLATGHLPFAIAIFAVKFIIVNLVRLFRAVFKGRKSGNRKGQGGGGAGQ